MSTSRAILTDSTPTNKWDQAIYAFSAEKQRRSGSNRTV